MPLPAQMRRLMKQTVSWEQLESLDKYGAPAYMAAVELSCHVEFVIAADRPPEEVRFVPQQALYFDGGDANVTSFQLRDRFTVLGFGDEEPLEAKTIDPYYGPDGDIWTVRVEVG